MFVAISLTKEEQSNEIIPFLLRKIIHIMKNELPKSVPLIFLQFPISRPLECDRRS